VYILKGSGFFGTGSTTRRAAHHVLTLTRDANANGLVVETDAADTLDFVLLSGNPLNEPVVQHGPFVLNTQAEVYKAMEDYSRGKNGFERAPGWRSEIGKPITDKYTDDDEF
jgi:redox-sensitive bicupin YhaK (pirin superfamily)